MVRTALLDDIVDGQWPAVGLQSLLQQRLDAGLSESALFPIELVPVSTWIRTEVAWGSLWGEATATGTASATAVFNIELANKNPPEELILGTADAHVETMGNTIFFSHSGDVDVPNSFCCTGVRVSLNGSGVVEFVVPHFGSLSTPVLFRLVELTSDLNRFSINYGPQTSTGEIFSVFLDGDLPSFSRITADNFQLVNLLAGDTVRVGILSAGSSLTSAQNGFSSFSQSFVVDVHAIGPSEFP